jgi:UDP-N-acetylmuramoylalanine--D-glutamate ligase
VTSLIGHLLQAAGKEVFVGGNIGTPVLEYLMEPEKSEILVLELSSFQLERGGAFRPDIGLLLNLSPDHLDWHSSMKAYGAAKQKIFAHQQTEDIALIGGDDELLAVHPPVTAGQLYRFGTGTDCRAVIEEHTVRLLPGFDRDRRPEMYELAATRLDSGVNRYNAAAALLAARCMGCGEDDIRRGLAEYQPPEHRMTPVARMNHVSFVNDSKATNVGAVIAALSGFDKNVVLIAGGRDKGSDFSLLRPAIRDHVTQVVTLGEAAADIGRAVQGIVPVMQAETMAEAVTLAYSAAEKEGTVLLAPACASFDMFSDYGQRGLAFSQCVQALAAEEDGRDDD